MPYPARPRLEPLLRWRGTRNRLRGDELLALEAFVVDSYADGLSLRQIAETHRPNLVGHPRHPAYRRSRAPPGRRPTSATTRPMIIQGPRRPLGRRLRRALDLATGTVAATLVPALASRAPWRRPNRTRRGIHGTGFVAAGGTETALGALMVCTGSAGSATPGVTWRGDLR